MLIRKCSAGHDIQIHLNNRRSQFVRDNGVSKKYFTLLNGKLVKQSDSFNECESAYLAECKKHHTPDQKVTGHMHPLDHVLDRGIVREKKRETQ